VSERDQKSWTVAEAQAGQTVAAVVRELVPSLSWSKARDLVRSGQVRVDGRSVTDSTQRLREGQRIEVGAGGPHSRGEPRREPELLVHLDADVTVVRKPAGLMTVPFERTDRDTLLSRARVAIRRLETRRGAPHNPSLRAVQRLDKDTSGLVVFARTISAQRDLQQQFTEHTALRRYLAVVHGLARDAVYDSILVPDRGDGLRGSVSPSPGGWGGDGRGGQGVRSRQAITHVAVQERLRGATLVACRLETGRTHQIRIHMAEAGHPLLGETVYVRDFAGPWLPAPRLMLHATELGFVHPRSGKEIRFTEPPPEDFAEAVERLKLSTTSVVER